MIIHISVNELNEPFRSNAYMVEKLYNLGIDYATNTLDGIFEDKEYTVFEFKNYGFVNDNRWNTYEISKGSAGILIEIVNTKE